jgi:long-chain acyl-CoA synthetase
MNLFDLLQGSVERSPEHAALIFGTRRITYRQLIQAAYAVSSRLRSLGVAPGDRVLMYAPNCPEYLAVYLACAHVGAIFAPVNVAFRAREMSYVLGNAEARVAFVHSEVAQQFQTLSADVRGRPDQMVIVDTSPEHDLFTGSTTDDRPLPACNRAAEDGALLCYTSGTTSTPKPVLHSHNSEIFAAKAYVAAWRMEATDRGLVTLPLAWIYGLSSASLALLTAGGTVLLMTHFNPERALERIQEDRATVFFGSMSMYVKMLDVLGRRDFDLSSLRLCTNGAEPCPEPLVEAFEKRAHVRLTGSYALSEVRPVFTEDPLDATAPPHSCGRLVSGASIRLLDGSGMEVSLGEVGEAYIRCPGMLSSYFREPELTQQRISADGWLKTGDLLRSGADGYYFVVGRTGDMIIRSGVNIAPAEIEVALLEHPHIAQAVVVGATDSVSGQAIIAFVVGSTGALLHDASLREHLSSRIAQYKIPNHFVVRSDLPTNASGKLDRATLNLMARQWMASAEVG